MVWLYVRAGRGMLDSWSNSVVVHGTRNVGSGQVKHGTMLPGSNGAMLGARLKWVDCGMMLPGSVRVFGCVLCWIGNCALPGTTAGRWFPGRPTRTVLVRHCMLRGFGCQDQSSLKRS
ncbi:unnamed protein product [Microthlaspi erraticum]|uniref:Uncharacterized protein n=1 Tax=Microthlaspi erraticum TaxID=1685480 RepID=A0A6D2IBL9_9BRAS|nr:unnamed protein product [Microthlaspi erraticum]